MSPQEPSERKALDVPPGGSQAERSNRSRFTGCDQIHTFAVFFDDMDDGGTAFPPE